MILTLNLMDSLSRENNLASPHTPQDGGPRKCARALAPEKHHSAPTRVEGEGPHVSA